MKAIVFEEVGNPSLVLKLHEQPLPEPKEGEVRVRVMASPVNPSDTMFIQGMYGIRPQLPSPAGFEGLGVIEAVGEGVSWPVGMRVSFTTIGAWAECVIVHHKALIPVPDSISDELAAQLFVNPFTAYAMVQESGVEAGQWLMLTACGSAFGKLVIQLCKKRGIRTIGTVRRDGLNEELLALGLDAVINTEKESVARRVKEITEGAGVRCILDAVGGATTEQALPALARGGKMLVYGLLSLQDPKLNIGLMIFKELTVKGFWLSEWMRNTDTATRLRVGQEVVGWLASGEVQLPIEATYSLENASEAVAHADSPGRWGKVLIKP